MTFRYSNTKFLTVLDPLPLDGIGWEAVALHVGATGDLTVMQRVYRATEMTGSKVRNDFGSGSIVIPKDDLLWDEALPSPLTGINPLNREFLWRFYEDGVLRHEFFGEDIHEDIAVEGESPRMVTISGRTPEVVLNWGVHVPAWAEVQDVRLDDSAEEGSFVLKFGTDTTDSIPHDASASEFKAAAVSGIPGLSSDDINVTKTVEDGQRIWHVEFVGQYLLGNAVPPGFSGKSSTARASVSGGGTAKYFPSVSDIQQVDYYASDQPQKAAKVFLDCLSRCQDRGILPFLIPLFDADKDSFGDPWLDNDVQEINPGETLLSMMQRFSEAYGWEFRILPGFRLQVSQVGFGVNRANTVRFWLGGHQISHSLARTSREMLTRVWAQTNTNFIVQAQGPSDASALARETWIDGFEGDSSYAQQVANKTLDERVGQTKLRSVKLPYNVDDDHRLFDDFSYCDWVGVEDDHNVMHVLKIESVAWKVGPESPIDFEVTFLGE